MSKPASHWWLVIGALPLIYVLSIGPAACVLSRMGAEPRLVATAYAPVIWLHDHTPLEKPLEIYVEAWTHR